jgi:hypothetical protein
VVGSSLGGQVGIHLGLVVFILARLLLVVVTSADVVRVTLAVGSEPRLMPPGIGRPDLDDARTTGGSRAPATLWTV